MVDTGRTPRRRTSISGTAVLTASIGVRAVVTVVATMLLAVGTVAPAQAATNTKVPGVNRFTVPASTRQVVVVRTASTTTSYATVETWRRSAASRPWVRTSGPHPGRVGYNGVSATRLQNSGKTPSGMFGLPSTFGPGPDPGTAMGWTRFDSRHWWVYDPKHQPTYNMIRQRSPGVATPWRTSWAEHLVGWGAREYKYAAVIGWNRPGTGRSNVRLGGGIFLHANGPGATAGCVSVTERYALSIVRWLRPTDRPRIVIGSRPWLAARP